MEPKIYEVSEINVIEALKQIQSKGGDLKAKEYRIELIQNDPAHEEKTDEERMYRYRITVYS